MVIFRLICDEKCEFFADSMGFGKILLSGCYRLQIISLISSETSFFKVSDLYVLLNI